MHCGICDTPSKCSNADKPTQTDIRLESGKLGIYVYKSVTASFPLRLPITVGPKPRKLFVACKQQSMDTFCSGFIALVAPLFAT